MPTISEVVTSAFTEIRSGRAGDVLSPDDMAWGLYILNRLLDSWNATRRKVYAVQPFLFTLIPNVSPHTIGPTGANFTVTQRPVSLDYAALNLGGTPNVFTPITVRNAQWFQRNSVPGISTSVPTDVYYAADWPNGSLYFYGVPSTAYNVRLWMRVLLAAVALTDTFSLPPGYQAAIELTLAEELASSAGQSVSASTTQRARDARDAVFSNNDVIPDAYTRDGGMPGGGRGGFNFLTGEVGGSN